MKTSLNLDDSQAALPTFLDHVRELQGRLFAIAIVFLLMAGAAYPFFDLIVNFLIAPLGNEHELVYLTPGGAFSFIIKVCMYIGAIGALPFMIYHLYRFLLPVVKPVNIRRALGYTLTSLVLAFIGLSFAYFVSLPAALYFLTGFNLHHINPMLTIDSYFSFIMTYMLAGAILFQLPLIINIINTIKPLSPGGMMKYQRHLIVGSFVVAAIISPTPDALNQIILALPVVLMYQVSIVAVWLMNRRKKAQPAVSSTRPLRPIGKLAVRSSLRSARPRQRSVVSMTTDQPARTNQQPKRPTRSIDGFISHTNSRSTQRTTNRRSVAMPTRPAATPNRSGQVRSIDGFMMPSR